MIDTHCHLNFKSFKKIVPDVIERAHLSGITHMVVPGTDVKTSKKAVEVAGSYSQVFAAVGIHPHHVYKLIKSENPEEAEKRIIVEISELIDSARVVAIGEVGLDKHEYEATVYGNYAVNKSFIDAQITLFTAQIELAKNHNISLILHNREAEEEFLEVLSSHFDNKLRGRTVFHCCEQSEKLLSFAKLNDIYIGVDGDITYDHKKQDFIREVPLDMLVLETDSPFLLPEPLKSERKFPNEPKNIEIIAQKVAEIKDLPLENIIKNTDQNAKMLFNLKS